MVITASVVGVQSFKERFHDRPLENAPALAQFRCNLTGLSQVHNLYFVACTAQIYVYVPQFPTQKLAEKPILRFTSQPSAPDLRGYLPQGHPHAINSLVVKFLGNEEVVAVVRDDGDVDAFLVRHVVSAIERRSEPLSELGVFGDEVRPFFQSNVGSSAWGLDLHAESRVLATSSNNHEVRVFKFGLHQAAEDDTSGSEDDTIPDADSEELLNDARRRTDVTQQILNGQSNIPFISFCNTGDDPEGRWLLTTDISGVCRLIDLQKSEPAVMFRYGPAFMDPYAQDHDRHNAGWVVGFLDRRSFQEEDSVDTALGLTENSRLLHLRRNPDIWDISKTVQDLPEFSEPFVYHRAKRRRTDRNVPEADMIRETDTGVQHTGESHYADLDETTGSDESSDGGAPLDGNIEVEFPTSEINRVDYPREILDTYNTNEDEDLEEDSSSGEWRTDPEQAEGTDSDPDQVTVIDDGDDPEDEMTEDSIPFTSWYNGESITANQPKFHELVHRINDSPWYDLSSPIFHASVRNVYLLQPFMSQPSSRAVPHPFNPPLVGIANPLRQAIQQDFEYLRMFERLNMMVSLPPLGIVVLASQKGRALVLQLTKVPASANYPPELKQLSGAGRSDSLPWMNKTQYTMRVACILPFASQEAANERPFAPLHGLAASPLQGCGDSAKGSGAAGSRWRVMLMYQDHSVLSYEIGRHGDRADGGVGTEDGMEVEDLIV